MAIETLLEDPMAFEIVLDRIVQILEDERDNQIALAIAAVKDPAPYNFLVRKEKSIPWDIAEIPVVNVTYLSSNFNENKNGVTGDKLHDPGVYIIDCYALADNEESISTGDITEGDTLSAINLHRIIKYVFSFLDADEYVGLGFPRRDSSGKPIGFISQRWIAEIQKFIPDQENRTSDHIIAARITFNVTFNELPPTVLGDLLEEIKVEIEQDGQPITAPKVEAEIQPN